VVFFLATTNTLGPKMINVVLNGNWSNHYRIVLIAELYCIV